LQVSWKVMAVALDTALRSAAIMSPALTAVVVKSDTVVLSITVPVEMETPLVLMEFDAVGIAVPVATFQVFTVAVPWSTTIDQPAMVQGFQSAPGIAAG